LFSREKVFIYKTEKIRFSTLFSSVTLKHFDGVNHHKCLKTNLLLPITQVFNKAGIYYAGSIYTYIKKPVW